MTTEIATEPEHTTGMSIPVARLNHAVLYVRDEIGRAHV